MIADIFDRFSMPPCAKLLGWTLLDSEPDAKWARFCFDGRAEFLNPAGFVQGGLLTAMLDDAIGSTVLIATQGSFYTVTIDLHVSFLAPARPGRIYAEGRVLQLGKTIAFIEAGLCDESGTPLARATSSARLVPADRMARRASAMAA